MPCPSWTSWRRPRAFRSSARPSSSPAAPAVTLGFGAQLRQAAAAFDTVVVVLTSSPQKPGGGGGLLENLAAHLWWNAVYGTTLQLLERIVADASLRARRVEVFARGAQPPWVYMNLSQKVVRALLEEGDRAGRAGASAVVSRAGPRRSGAEADD